MSSASCPTDFSNHPFNPQPPKSIDRVSPPPRLLLGTTLLFWGAMTGRPMTGLVCALLVEGRHWLKLRWDFNDASYESAWQLSFVLTLLTAVLVWLDESRYTAILVLMGWLPVLLMPLQFVQGYGLRNSVQLTAFSLLARRSRLRSQRLGLMVDPVRFNFGNVTFIVTLLSSAVGMSVESMLFLPGVVVLCGWMLMASGRCRWGTLLPVLLVAGGLGFAGQYGLDRLEKWVRRGGGQHGDQFNPNFQSTSIGQRGRVLQSPEVMWRLIPEEGSQPPSLLRTATFSHFLGLNWQNQRHPFMEIDAEVINERSQFVIADDAEPEDLDGLPEFTLRGTVDKIFPIPLPGDAASMAKLLGAKVEKNVLGTIRISPSASVVEAGVLWRSDYHVEGQQPQMPDPQKGIARVDRDVVEQVAAELGLAQLPTLRQKLDVLERWFENEFRYTLDLTIRQPSIIDRMGDDRPPSAMMQFLTDVRAGHCEYFATAATLILRSVGVHARYVVGFAVMEKADDRNEYLIRGTHAHAWCRVWDEQNQTWLDFDPTPPGWMDQVATGGGWMQPFKDWIKRIREDFYLWRTNPENELMVLIVMSVFGVGLALVVVRRLWRSRSQIEEDVLLRDYEGPRERTPLHQLEELARRCVGERPAGMTYSCWLLQVESKCGQLDGLGEAIFLHQQWRFDPQPVTQSHRQRLEQLATELELSIRPQLKAQS